MDYNTSVRRPVGKILKTIGDVRHVLPGKFRGSLSEYTYGVIMIA